jgi:hypothetical protein
MRIAKVDASSESIATISASTKHRGTGGSEKAFVGRQKNNLKTHG